MKNILVLILIISLLLLASCSFIQHDPDNQTPGSGNTPPSEENQTPGSGNTPPSEENQTPDTYVGFGYAEGEITSVIFTNVKSAITFDITANSALMSGLNNLKYNPADSTTETKELLYKLNIDGKNLDVYEGNIVSYDSSLTYPTQGFDICTYLSALFVGEVTQPLCYSDDPTVKLQNNKGLSAEITDKSSLLSTLSLVKVIALSTPADYNINAANYTISIDDTTIVICGNYIKIDEDLYAVIEGDFAFLSDYKYSSDTGGFLPWV